MTTPRMQKAIALWMVLKREGENGTKMAEAHSSVVANLTQS